jgi:hypothetical protein
MSGILARVDASPIYTVYCRENGAVRILTENPFQQPQTLSAYV